MKITFVGATHEVTGSCYFLEAAGKKFLVDFGMEQGPDNFENIPIPVPASELDFVLLTHAHIDHSGKLPVLYAEGFRGNIYTTYATVDLCEIMLRDSAHIQMFEAEWRNRKGQRSGKEPVQPLYDMNDAQGAISHLVGCPYQQILELADGIQVRFVDAGHLLGSASIELWLKEDDVERKIVFSGDIGNKNQPLIKDPTYLQSADKVSLCFALPDDEAGALYRIMSHFIFNGINLTRIESRPSKGGSWGYQFFIDFEGNLRQEAVVNALRGLKEETSSFRILGNYQSFAKEN